MKLSFPILSQKNIAVFDFESLNSNCTYMVWWYGAVVEDDGRIAQPYVQVLFREVLNRHGQDLTLSSRLIKQSVPLPLLSSVLIGSLWHDGESSEIIEFPSYLLNISFDESGWCVKAVNELEDKPSASSFPLTTYPLKYGKNDQTKFITFDLNNGGKLIFNTLEFFRGSYGHSMELKRILMRYPYQSVDQVESILSLLIHAVDTEEQDAWIVKQPKRSLTKGDAIFLAHLKYDLHTQHTIKRLTNERIKGWDKTRGKGLSSYFFPAITPWHQSQDIQIRVQGLPYGENNILGLRIEKISDPHGIPVHWIKYMPNSVVEKKEDIDSTSSTTTNVITRKKKVNRIPVTTHVRGDINTSSGVLPLASMTIGNNRVVKVIATTVPIQLRGSKKPTELIDRGLEAYSAADDSGSRGKTGRLVSQVDENDSVLSRFENAWNEAKSLLSNNQLSKVEWYDRKNEVFVSSEAISAIGLQANNGYALRVSQAFMMQLTTPDHHTLLCIELTGKTGKEGFSGLMLEINQDAAELASWIEWLLTKLICHKGIFKRFMPKSSYKHYKIYHHGRSNRTIERVLKGLTKPL